MSSTVPTTAPDTTELPVVPELTVAPEAPADSDTPAVSDTPVAAVETAESAEAAEPAATEAPVTAEAPAAVAAAPAGPEMTPAACAQQLKERFPALFAGTPKPLKLRIQADIKERAPGVFTKAVMSAFLRRYTGTTAYLIALTKAEHRVDLDGQPAGEITEEHRTVAQQELDRRRAIHQERRAQETQAERARRDQARTEERAAQAKQREEQELQEVKRRNRAHLLRDFEQTTLTRGNFCVLKGLPESDLDRVLDIARKEREEWVASRPAAAAAEQGEHRRPDHRPPSGPRRNDAPRADNRAPRRHDDRPRREGRGEGAGAGAEAGGPRRDRTPR